MNSDRKPFTPSPDFFPEEGAERGVEMARDNPCRPAAALVFDAECAIDDGDDVGAAKAIAAIRSRFPEAQSTIIRLQSDAGIASPAFRVVS